MRPPYAGIDLDPARRPGVPMLRDPEPWPHTRYPPQRQPGEPAAPKHGRPGKVTPPVFGTATPLHGISGLVRRAGYALPDHQVPHWLLILLGDRVDSAGRRLKRALPFLAPALLAGLGVRRLVRTPGRPGRGSRRG